MSWAQVVMVAIIAGFFGRADAHIGDRIYLIFEVPDSELSSIDLKDGSISDWEDVVGDPSLLATDFHADPTVGEGAQYDPADLDYRIWLGWNSTKGVCYLAQERKDNVYINTYPGGSLDDLWSYDSIEFMLDGDHSGGDYTGSADPNWTADEQKLNNNRTAQQYTAIATSPDGRTVGYLGAGTDWVNTLPYTNGGGRASGKGPTTAITEFYVTPFDDLIWNSPGDSKASPLFAGKIIGFQISVPDFDSAPREYHAYYTLTGQAATWRYAERFADGRLVAAPVHRSTTGGYFSNIDTLTSSAPQRGLTVSAGPAGGRTEVVNSGGRTLTSKAPRRGLSVSTTQAGGYRHSKPVAVQAESWGRIKASFQVEENGDKQE